MSTWMAFLFVVVGGLVAFLGALANHIIEQRRQTRTKLREDVIQTYIEESIVALQKDLALGLGAAARMDKLLNRMSLITEELKSEDAKTMLVDIRSIEFKPDANSKFIGYARVKAFGEIFGKWVLCGYRSIGLYLDLAHSVAAQKQQLLDGDVELTDEAWRKTEDDLNTAQKLCEVTHNTVTDIISDLDILGIIARNAKYTSYLDVFLNPEVDPMFQAVQKIVEPKVADYEAFEKEISSEESEEQEAEHLDEEAARNDS